MEKNIEQNSLIKVNEKSLFYKIKRFFMNLFKKNTNYEETQTQSIENIIQDKSKTQKQDFRETIKQVETEETKLLKLQKQFDNGEITEEELSQKQIEDLLNLYNQQINELEKSNNLRKEKILKYKSKMQSV